MKRIPTLAAAACLVLLSACGGGDGGSGGADSGDVDTSATLRYAASGGATSFDPHKTVSSSDFLVLSYAYDRLVHVDSEGQPVPGLAESWEFAEDMSTLTLNLRQGVEFPDGTPFDAKAVKANLDRAMQDDSITAAQLGAVDSVRVVDDATVELALGGPAVHLVLSLSDLGGMMVTPSAFDDPKALALAPDGIGRFTLADSQPGARYQFEATENYWDEDGLKLAGFDLQVITDPQTVLNGVGSDQFDCALVSPAMIDPASQIPGTNVETRTVLTQTVLFPNQTKSEFGDVRVRQALNHAIDREAVLEGAQEGHGEASTGLFPSDYFVPNDAVSDLMAYDPDRAKELLAEAGLEDGFSFTAITLTIPQFVTTAEIIKEQLAAVGIEMTIKALPPADAGVSFLNGDSDAVISGWTGRPDPSMLLTNYFAEDAPQNVSHVEPEGFTDALAAANAEEDTETRGELLDAAQLTVLEHGAVVPITFNSVGTVCSEDVVGYEAPLIGNSEFRGVGITG
ncbi:MULTISPECIES: ABC transporter substrate-binding protein [unclassified Nocardioides]|uniref:ABC transporter substrate-binding protein n=1 Tax=unclassified Nocardioides TaxID=2615069 RepID=UPI00188620DB|nr:MULTISPECIES: ABC transporter substrate-binding protein [unclassified Nocardioides]